MPINYLHLQPQIEEYCQQALINYQQRSGKINLALKLLQRFANEIDKGDRSDLSVLKSADAATAAPFRTMNLLQNHLP
ncbi:MAG: hypothetical protein J7L66_04040 [Anaerolineaceae bacterium]|nr:hypothetical protein [Anaerolineaceae bacterium]